MSDEFLANCGPQWWDNSVLLLNPSLVTQGIRQGIGRLTSYQQHAIVPLLQDGARQGKRGGITPLFNFLAAWYSLRARKLDCVEASRYDRR
jgi:hypothetical protein